jgi:hypothetical protein
LTFNTGPTYQSQAEQLKQVQAEGGFELKSRLYADPAAYSKAIGNYLLEWRNTSQDGFQNKLDYIQALLRGSGMSSDDTPRGVFGVKDTAALKDASLIALQNGIPFVQVLEELYKTKGGGGAAKFSKQVATSIKLIDPTDAKASLSDAYYQAFGAFPSDAQIKNYMNLYNAEAKRQKGKSITTYNTSGTVTTQQTTTMDEGFTEKEQQKFLAEYLVKNYDMTSSEELGGTAKSLYDAIVGTYAANYLDEPDFETVTGVIKNVLSSSDDKTATQQLETFLQQGRKIASKQWLGLEKELSAGENISTYTTPLAKSLTKLFGRTVNYDDPLIKKAINFKDEKGVYRMMNEIELSAAAESDPRYAVSSGAINKATSLADKIATALGE